MASMIRQPGMGMGGGAGSQDERSCRGLQRGPRSCTLGIIALAGFVALPNKVAGIVCLIILYHRVTGFGLVQRTYRLI